MIISGRTPHGVRGLKYDTSGRLKHPAGRTPHGVRGLKLIMSFLSKLGGAVAPRMGGVD